MTSYKLAVIIAALPVVCLPSLALAHTPAQHINVIPAEASIDNLAPGEAAEFELTVQNQDELPHRFAVTTFNPREEDRREGRAELPDNSWINFSSQEIEVDANSVATVKVTVAVPPEQEWAGKDWEIWLGVAAESDDLLVTKLYVRVLVSTSGKVEGNPDTGLLGGIALAAIAVGYGTHYYLRRRTGPE